VPAPPEGVFAFVEDIRNLPRWQDGVESAERTSSGAVGVGSTARVRRQLLGQPLVLDLVVIEHDPPRRLSLETTVQGLRVVVTLDIAPSGSRSRVTFATAFHGRGMSSFLEPVLANTAEGEVGASLKRLRLAFAC
jgi:uncharacterized protein YndB with AHSA1/START domain